MWWPHVVQAPSVYWAFVVFCGEAFATIGAQRQTPRRTDYVLFGVGSVMCWWFMYRYIPFPSQCWVRPSRSRGSNMCAAIKCSSVCSAMVFGRGGTSLAFQNILPPGGPSTSIIPPEGRDARRQQEPKHVSNSTDREGAAQSRDTWPSSTGTIAPRRRRKLTSPDRDSSA